MAGCRIILHMHILKPETHALAQGAISEWLDNVVGRCRDLLRGIAREGKSFVAATLTVVDCRVALFEDDILLGVIVIGAWIVVIGFPLLLQTHGPPTSLVCTHAHRGINVIEADGRRAVAPSHGWPHSQLAKVDALHPIFLL